MNPRLHSRGCAIPYKQKKYLQHTSGFATNRKLFPEQTFPIGGDDGDVVDEETVVGKVDEVLNQRYEKKRVKGKVLFRCFNSCAGKRKISSLWK